MRRFTLLALISVSACSPTVARGPSMAPSGPTFITGSGSFIELAEDKRGLLARVPVPIDSAWAALPSVYAELGIDIGTMISAAHRIGNLEFIATRRLGGVRLDEYFRCGRTSAGASAANSYRLYISILTDLAPVSAGETEVHTLAQASARSNSGASRDPVMCTSTGELEGRIAEALR
ncbi:MAG TPA: hypothetical protein VFI91_09820 [Longimicrobiaceae bacterium]|nr:hypothetical protein [Longimicrobiaceae bacterium]